MNTESFPNDTPRRIRRSELTTKEQWQDWLRAHPIDWEKINGLLPAIVQDERTRQVLMQGFMNPESLKQSLDSGKVTFFSRSRQRLWCKGESSGNFLYIRELALDCDRDSLLILAQPCGPTCHEGSNSCYSVPCKNDAPAELHRLGSGFSLSPEQPGHEGRESLGLGWLGALEQIIRQRRLKAHDSETHSNGTQKDSYVQHLFAQGLQRMAQKVGEEGVEVALAAMALKQAQTSDNTQKQTEQELRHELAAEAGDLLFHLAVLLQACDMSLQDAIEILEQRHRKSLDKQRTENE
ncbi:bifunctional phosphoribosyl-AMP cyclohydrolase/phosphoribosyl-ATP diphosphatase HisIE [Candidatus Haliotispira prima]|uniref:Histidine biosynthesis bifunctional protein HisIE n=1 Tax=Candidatus Haliotispira prima TaxID=3034016 RepID=A0ABY8MII1_9SPIO|nr:bifunctional phosphoribosyl-AMP cyclohydrolase/phosphoribosyl-ATP diphosphatase HisIE [Candidatus Haliotispira prima]